MQRVTQQAMDCAELLALFYWLQFRLVSVKNCVERLKRDTMRRVQDYERAR